MVPTLACSAGSSPHSTPVTMVSASVNSSTVRSSRIASDPGQAARTRSHQPLQRPPRHHQADERADERQHHRLGEQLPHHPRASRAEREPGPRLPPPRRAAAEQQAGNVRARNGQDERHRAEQHRHRLTQVAEELLVERDQRRAASTVVGRILLREALRNGLRFETGLTAAASWLFTDRPAAQNPRPSEHGVERRAQLVQRTARNSSLDRLAASSARCDAWASCSRRSRSLSDACRC